MENDNSPFRVARGQISAEEHLDIVQSQPGDMKTALNEPVVAAISTEHTPLSTSRMKSLLSQQVDGGIPSTIEPVMSIKELKSLRKDPAVQEWAGTIIAEHSADKVLGATQPEAKQ